jgi:hypothetical protein
MGIEKMETLAADLFHPFQTRTTLRWSLLFLLRLSKHIFIEEVVLHADSVDDAVDNHCFFPTLCAIKILDPESIPFPQISQGGFVKGEDLFSQFLKGFFHKNSYKKSK